MIQFSYPADNNHHIAKFKADMDNLNVQIKSLEDKIFSLEKQQSSGTRKGGQRFRRTEGRRRRPQDIAKQIQELQAALKHLNRTKELLLLSKKAFSDGQLSGSTQIRDNCL